MKLKNIITIVIGLILLLFLFTCKGTEIKNKVIVGLGGYTHKEYTKTIDTFKKTVKVYADENVKLHLRVDSLNTRTTTINYVVSPKNQNGSSQSTNLAPNLNKDPSTLIPIAYTSFNTVSDTLIHGTIKTVINSENCEIVEQSFDYTPKFPILVKEYITIKEKETETLSIEPTSKIGLGSSITTQVNASIFGVYQTKNNWQIQAGIGIDLNTQAPNNRYIQVGIVKLF